jgi:plastocyanin
MAVKHRATAAALTLAALALSACGSSGSSDKNPVTVHAPGKVGAAVSYENYNASPKTITVKVGQPVTWTNKDGAAHNVVSTSAPSADKISSPSISQGDTFTFTPSAVGTIKYVCTFHPQMTGYSVVVTQ